MIPRIDIEVDSALPNGFPFWTPTEEDIDEEGIGCYFRNVWLIRGVTRAEAEMVLEDEQNIVRLVDELASDAEVFEVVAKAVESLDQEALPSELAEKDAYSALCDEFHEDVDPLEGLDLGVSGLVHALSAAGCFPAASCRGHATERPWSDRPVVLVAMDRYRAEWMQPMVHEAGCGFAIDETRPQLLTIEASSIENIMTLARMILDRLDQLPWIESSPDSIAVDLHPGQESLW